MAHRTLGALLFAGALVVSATASAAPPPGVERGQRLAERDCAMCHAVGAEGRSPNGAAPTFRAIGLRYNALSLESALRRLAKQGHFEMPRRPISEAEIPDLAAYIQSLRSR